MANSKLLEQYEQDGFVCLPQLIDKATCKMLHDDFIDFVGPDPEPLIYGIWRHNVWTQVPSFRQVLLSGDLGRLAAEFLQCDEIILFQDTVIWKPPGSLERVQWHQDYSYWPLDKPHGITIWVALTDSDKQNGCMSFLPGSHHWGECQPMLFSAEKAYPHENHLPKLRWQEHESERHDYPCLRGDGAAMTALNCHMSHGNQSQHHRVGWVVTFVHPSVRWQPDHATHPFNYVTESTADTPIKGDIFPRFRRNKPQRL